MESFVQGLIRKTGGPLGKEKVPRDLTSAVPTLPLPHLKFTNEYSLQHPNVHILYPQNVTIQPHLNFSKSFS